MSFEAAMKDLRNPDQGARLQAVQMFKRAGYPESAIPLAAVVTDPLDQIQFEAIAAELNIFLDEQVVPNRRVGPVVEARNKIEAEPIFSAGRLALNGRPVPVEVLTALARAAGDENPLVALEALYAFGTLGVDASGATRRDMLRSSGPQLAGMLGVPDAAMRTAAVRVIGRLFERRPGDEAVGETLGDGVIAALNDRDRDLQLAAMDTLGALRYERAVHALTELFEFYRRNALGLGALGALARIGSRSSAPLFLNELSTGNASTRVLAIEGLARLDDKAAAATIRTAVARERNQDVLLAESFAQVMLAGGAIDPLVEALARSGLRNRALEYLIEAAPGRSASFGRMRQDPDPRLRADIADVLGLSGDPAALAVVEPMMKDTDPHVSRLAARAVVRLRRQQ
jgi:HEAT repeat protein